MSEADEPKTPTFRVPELSPNITTSTFGPGKWKVMTTGPDEILGHWITDDQLEMLRSANRDGLSEAFWAFVAATLAALPAAAEAVWKAYVEIPQTPLSVLHLCEVFIVAGSATLAIAIRIISGKRSKRADTLVDQIRARQKLPWLT